MRALAGTSLTDRALYGVEYLDARGRRLNPTRVSVDRPGRGGGGSAKADPRVATAGSLSAKNTADVRGRSE
jgi:hypothetical protein